MNEKTKAKLGEMRKQAKREHSGEGVDPYFAQPREEWEPKLVEQQQQMREYEEEQGWDPPSAAHPDAQAIMEELGLGMFEPGPEEQQQARVSALRQARENATRLKEVSRDLASMRGTVHVLMGAIVVTVVGLAVHVLFGG